MIRTKLMPPSSARGLVSRPRLQTLIAALAQTKVAVVRAPAGFGKTTLLSQWYDELRAGDQMAGWLSFDSGDGDALDMLAYLVRALESAGHVFAPAVGSLVAADGYATPEAVIDAVAADLCRATQPLYLFLDDVHVLRGPSLERTLAAFVERAPDVLHIAMATREVPEMPLARARALGDVVEITAADLRFSKAETAEFMAASGSANLRDADLDVLEGRVEGWVAGLKLASIAFAREGATAGVMESISGRGWTFAEFFVEVVIAQQSPELADFLLQTSVLERFSPALCDAVTAGTGARELLDEIEARGLFIFSLDGERRWYRYHHLFADFLRSELSRRNPGRELELHARASRWLAAAGFKADAFRHAIKANDCELAAALLDERCHTMFYDGQVRVLLEFAAQLPPPVVARYPRIQLARAWSLVLEWKFAEARTILAAVKETLAERRGTGGPSREDMLYLHCTMMLAQFEDDMPAVARQCATLLDRFMDAHPYLVGTYYTSLLYAEREHYELSNVDRFDARARDYFQIAGSRFVFVWHQAIAGPTRFLAGDTLGAIEALEDGLEAATAISGRISGLASIPALLLAEVYYERNELAAARELLERHLALAGQLGFVDQLVAGYITQSRLHRVAGDMHEAERVLGRGLDIAHSRGFRRLELNIVAEQMTHSVAMGRTDRAGRLADVHGLRVPAEDVLPAAGTTTGAEARAIAWTGLAQAECRIPEALRVAKRWHAFADRAGAVRSAIRWSTVVARLLLLSGDALGAERAIRQSLSSAADGRFVRTFLDLGRQLPALLGDPLASDEAQAPTAADAFARELTMLAQAANGSFPRLATGAENRSVALSEPLNPRELEIVELVASGMSNRGIAERLGLTEGTVKWHLHRIFDKVGARRRTQVVYCARRFGLIA
jgi:LuxR family maltose regulon positive regulatory protein